MLCAPSRSRPQPMSDSLEFPRYLDAPQQILFWTVDQMVPFATFALIGLAAALALLALAQVLHGVLFGISTADPAALALTLLTPAAAGLIASLLPTLRAARVEPAQVLRAE